MRCRHPARDQQRQESDQQAISEATERPVLRLHTRDPYPAYLRHNHDSAYPVNDRSVSVCSSGPEATLLAGVGQLSGSWVSRPHVRDEPLSEACDAEVAPAVVKHRVGVAAQPTAYGHTADRLDHPIARHRADYGIDRILACRLNCPGNGSGRRLRGVCIHASPIPRQREQVRGSHYERKLCHHCYADRNVNMRRQEPARRPEEARSERQDRGGQHGACQVTVGVVH